MTNGSIINKAWLLFILIVSFPFGPLIANISYGISIFFLSVDFIRKPALFTTKNLPRSLFISACFALAYIAWLSLTTCFNVNKQPNLLGAILGYLPWAILPCLFRLDHTSFSSISIFKKCTRLLVIMTGLWGLIIVSQYVFEWRLLAFKIVHDDPRPRGFYSHPLSLAYVLILLWPLSLNYLFGNIRKIERWVFFLAIASGILLSQSRTVQAVAFGFGFIFLLKNLQGTRRYLALAFMILASASILMTKNIISDKFIQTFSSQGVDRHSNYADDRLAFWDAHWLMIKERPVLGHGWGMNDQYRQPYYARLGLNNFQKAYGAHNVFIQILSEGGLIGLIIFLLWLASFVSFIRTLNPFAKAVGWQTFLLFFLASITQNTLQDFSVRWVLSLFCTALALWGIVETKEQNL